MRYAFEKNRCAHLRTTSTSVWRLMCDGSDVDVLTLIARASCQAWVRCCKWWQPAAEKLSSYRLRCSTRSQSAMLVSVSVSVLLPCKWRCSLGTSEQLSTASDCRILSIVPSSSMPMNRRLSAVSTSGPCNTNTSSSSSSSPSKYSPNTKCS